VRWPGTLFARMTLVIASVAFVFQILVVGAIIFFVMLPQGRHAGDRLAGLLVDVAHVWAQVPENQRQAYEEDVRRKHAIHIQPVGQERKPLKKVLPFYHVLESAVRLRTDRTATLYSSTDEAGKSWVWIDIPTRQGPIAVGFDRAMHPQYPTLLIVMILILAVGAMAALAVSAYLARYLTRPLRHLSAAVRRMGTGQKPDVLPEEGPEEFVHCARAFNRMTAQIQDLFAARTTLLAGISHDLRAPLARMRLALGMLTDKHEPALVSQLMSDVDAMNGLIERCLEVGHGFEETQKSVDVHELLRSVVEEMGIAPGHVAVVAGTDCHVHARPLALRRILANLVDNAVKYGGLDGLKIELDCDAAEIRILDAGPGIPAEQVDRVFQPFYRLEPSRCQATGGSGLGLAIVRQLADANGWRVTLENRAAGGMLARLQLAPAWPQSHESGSG